MDISHTDKALEAAADAYNKMSFNTCIEMNRGASHRAAIHAAITAYHAALAGQGESGEIRKRLQTAVAQYGGEQSDPCLARLLTDCDTRLVELERERDAESAARHADLGRLMEATGVVNDGVASPAKLFERCLAKAAEAERLRALRYAVNSFIEAVKPLADDVEQGDRALASGGWQDMESAPRDNTPVLIATDYKAVGEASYEPERCEWYWAGSHWTDAYDGSVRGNIIAWQHLPDPPESTLRTGEDG